jgi:putative toxin-antitoxin system antitoxin component (TIGR02293 family)
MKRNAGNFDKAVSSQLNETVVPYGAGMGGLVGLQITSQTSRAAKAIPAKLLIEEIRKGLPFAELEALQNIVQTPLEKLGLRLGISKATLHRRKLQGRLAPEESDRVIRFARLVGKAIQTMESEEAARQWLNTPQFGLGGAVPLDYAETEIGAREVEDLLERIEYGVLA